MQYPIRNLLQRPDHHEFCSPIVNNAASNLTREAHSLPSQQLVLATVIFTASTIIIGIFTASISLANSLPSLSVDAAGNVALTFSVGQYCGSTAISNQLRHHYLPRNGLDSEPLLVSAFNSANGIAYNFISQVDVQKGNTVVLYSRPIINSSTSTTAARRFTGATFNGNRRHAVGIKQFFPVGPSASSRHSSPSILTTSQRVAL